MNFTPFGYVMPYLDAIRNSLPKYYFRAESIFRSAARKFFSILILKHYFRAEAHFRAQC